jgi:hypothetical protein
MLLRTDTTDCCIFPAAISALKLRRALHPVPYVCKTIDERCFGCVCVFARSPKCMESWASHALDDAKLRERHWQRRQVVILPPEIRQRIAELTRCSRAKPIDLACPLCWRSSGLGKLQSGRRSTPLSGLFLNGFTFVSPFD